MLQWSDTYLFSLQVQVSFRDIRAQNKLKHQERAIYSYSFKKFSEKNNEGTNINYKCNASDTLARHTNRKSFCNVVPNLSIYPQRCRLGREIRYKFFKIVKHYI